METELTPSESLKLIDDMIRQANRSFHRMSYYFLLWGVVLIVAMASQLIAIYAGWSDHGYTMIIAGIIGGVLSAIHGRREGQREAASSPMDRVLVWLWAGFIITMLIMIVAGGTQGQAPGAGIVVLTGLPTFLTGQMMKFKPLILGGILFWVLGAVSYLVEPMTGAVLYVVAMLLGYIVPGIMLKRQEDGLRTA